MVTITGVNTRETKDGRSFLTLQLSGGLQFVQSMSTGKFYAKMSSTSIPCVFEETLAKQLIGTQMPGEIVKIDTDPYEFVTQSGEVMMLNHTYSYRPSPEAELIPDALQKA